MVKRNLLRSAGFFPVGTSFTWGARSFAYEVFGHEIDKERNLLHRCHKWDCATRQLMPERGTFLLTAPRVAHLLRENQSIFAPSIEGLWRAIDDEAEAELA